MDFKVFSKYSNSLGIPFPIFFFNVVKTIRNKSEPYPKKQNSCNAKEAHSS